jgi:glycerol-3-phosphate dehydrogenase
MRVLGAGPGPLRRLLPWLVSLALLGLAAGLAIWARQQDAARRLAENRADAAEARAVAAETTLTAVARTAAAATATAVAINNAPEMALRRALDLVFEAYKDPSEGKLRALSDAFSPEALGFERTEAEHLISGGMRLASGTPPYQLSVLSTSPGPSGATQVTTHEIWTYDEVDSSNRRTRCVREESDQTYALRRVGAGWIVETVTLSGATHRTDC